MDNLRRLPSVAITIVTFNSSHFIRRCLEAALAQSHPAVEIIVIDNASNDGTRDVLQPFAGQVQAIFNHKNTGFAAAQNQAIALASSEWVLCLNPDVVLEPDFLTALVEAAHHDVKAGTACGKLLRMTASGQPLAPPIIDSTGIYFTPALRHLDRGSEEPDCGQYGQRESVFGATGAAALYRRRMIDDVALEGEFFDSDFFAYREDADVAWRAQLLGWQCLYVPEAVGYHVRSVVPANRHSVAPILNMHSVKNRFLMRIKNATGDLYRRFWLSITVRDCLVLAGCLLRERASLRAFVLILKSWKQQWHKRRLIMARRRVDGHEIARWFSDRPVSFASTGAPLQEKVASQ